MPSTTRSWRTARVAAPDDEAAGLALAATIAGGGDDEAESDADNPFLAGEASDGDGTDDAVNPFVTDDGEAVAEEKTKA